MLEYQTIYGDSVWITTDSSTNWDTVALSLPPIRMSAKVSYHFVMLHILTDNNTTFPYEYIPSVRTPCIGLFRTSLQLFN